MKTRILIVDDEPGIRQSLSGILEDEGFQVEAVENGEACLDLLARSIFELVILDIWLPGIDGLETLNRIQKIPRGGPAGGGGDFGPRHDRDGGESHQAGRLRFSGEAAFDRSRSAGGETRAGPSAAAA